MWPTPQDYNEAVQNTTWCFLDDELRRSQAETNHLGLPKPVSGTFASVYHMRGHAKEWAVRCFLQEFGDRETRYARISHFLAQNSMSHTVGFEFVQQGIRVHGRWYPTLKMEWVNGQGLVQWIEGNLAKPNRIELLRDRFAAVCRDLANLGIAHGDLQHGNILVVDDTIKLVDYDGMFVPALEGYASNELGHRNYQHPARNKTHFGAYLDNFSAWSIYSSLTCLSQDYRLWTKLGGGDDCLLFKHEDYIAPDDSVAFRVLEHHDSALVRQCARTLRSLLRQQVPDIPALGEPVSAQQSLAELAPPEKLAGWKLYQSADSNGSGSKRKAPIFAVAEPSAPQYANLRVAQQIAVAETMPKLVVPPSQQSQRPAPKPPIAPGTRPGQRRISPVIGSLPPNTPPMLFRARFQKGKRILLAVGGALWVCSFMSSAIDQFNARLHNYPHPVPVVRKDLRLDHLTGPGAAEYETAQNLRKQGKYLEASQHYDKAINAYADDPKRFALQIAACKYGLGKSESSLDNNSTALNWLHQAKDAFEAARIYIPGIDDRIGWIATKEHRFPSAASHFKEEWRRSLQMGLPEDAENARESLLETGIAMVEGGDRRGLSVIAAAGIRPQAIPASAQSAMYWVGRDLSLVGNAADRLVKDGKLELALQVRQVGYDMASKAPGEYHTLQIEQLEALVELTDKLGRADEHKKYKDMLDNFEGENVRRAQAKDGWTSGGLPGGSQSNSADAFARRPATTPSHKAQRKHVKM